MTKLLVLGARGQIARHVIADLAPDTDIEQTLFARRIDGVRNALDSAILIQGDVLNRAELDAAMVGQDVVYANLTGEDLDDQARAVIASMQANGVKRLIFVLALGVYDEVPGRFGQWNAEMIGEDLKPFRRAAGVITSSGLDFTIVRPAWLTDADEVDYETTTRDQPFKGTEVSRRSVAAFIADLVRDPSQGVGGDFGLNKPGTDGDKPAFM